MFKANIITGLDIGSDSIKLVQLKSTPQGWQVLKVCRQPLGPELPSESEEKTKFPARTLKEFLEKNKIKAASLISAVPRHQVTVRYITLPSIDAAEIEQMVKFEAEKHTLFPTDKMTLDFQTIEKRVEDSEVLLVAVGKETIDEHLALLGKVKLTPEIIDVESFAIHNCYVYNRNPTTDSDITVALVHIGAKTTQINIMNGELLLFTRSILMGSRSFSRILQEKSNLSSGEIEALQEKFSRAEPESAEAVNKDDFLAAAQTWYQQLLDELRYSFDAFKVEPHGKDIHKILLSGGGSYAAGLEEFLEENLEVEIERINPFRNLPFSAGIDGHGLDACLTVAVGLALRKDKHNNVEVNLIPDEIKKKQGLRRRRKKVITAGAVACLAAIIGVSFFLSIFFSAETRLKELDGRLKQLNPTVREVKKVKSQMEIIKNYTDNQNLCLDILRQLSLTTVIPPDAYITDLVFEKDKSVSIRGRTLAHSTVSGIVAALEKTPYFKGVASKYSRAIKIGGKDLVEFEVICSLKGKP